MALEAGGEDLDVTGTGFGDLSLNPSFGLDPSYDPRAVKLVPKQIFPETSSALLAPLSTTYAPPGTRMASLAPAPGQPVNLLPQTADLAPPPPAVQPVIQPGSVAPPVQGQQIAQTAPAMQSGPRLSQPSPTPGANVQPQGWMGTALSTAPKNDPNAELQNRLESLQKQSDQAYQQGWGRWRQIFDDEGAKESQKEYARIQTEIANVRQQIETQNTNQQLAKNSGLFQKVDSSVDAAGIAARQIDEWKNQGNIMAWRGLRATGHAEQANIYNPEGFEKLGKDVTNVETAFGYLDNAKSEADYKIQREKALKEVAKNPNAANLGLTEGKIPQSREEYRARRGLIQGPKNDAAEAVSTYQRQQENRGVPQIITDEKVAGSVIKPFRYSNGESMPNLDAVTLGDMGGQIGAKGTGQKDLSRFGIDYHDGTPAQIETYTKQLGSEESKDALQKFKMVSEFQKIATNPKMMESGAGVGLVYDATLSIGRDLAEGAKAAGTVGFAKILESKLGNVESWVNKAKMEISALKQWLNEGGKGTPPPDKRLSEQTIQGLKDIANYKLQLSTAQMGRINGAVATAGRYGIPLDQIGLGPDEQELVKPVWEAAAQKTRLDKDSYPARIYGNDRIYLPKGTTGKDVIPPGSYAAHVNATIDNVIPPPPAVVVPPPPAVVAPGAFPTGGTAPVGGFVPPGAVAVPGRRSEAAPPSVGNVIQGALGISPVQAAGAPPIAANVPASWGITAPQAGAFPAMPVAPTGAGGRANVAPAASVVAPTAVSPGGGRPTVPVVTPSAAGGGGGTLAPVPSYLRNNPVASTVYTSAGETARNLSGGNVVVGNNVAKIAVSSAASESSFKPHELHDRDLTTGEYAGYGLFGHQGDRLRNMQKSGGVEQTGKPGNAILPEAQTAFYAREIMDAAKKDPFIAKVLNDPNASAEDLTRVQMRMEQPKGYNGPGTEEKGHNWAGRLANTQKTMLGSGQQISGAAVGSPGAAVAAEAGYYGAGSRMMPKAIENAPAIGATIGGTVTAPYGPVAQAGGAILGGTTGGLIKHGLTAPPEQQTFGGYTKAGVEAAGESLPMAIPGAGVTRMAARAGTAGAVEGAKELYETGGDIPKALTVATGSVLSAAGVETFMYALGKGASGIYKMATNNNKKALENAGAILSEQKPKTMLADGTTVENKAYTTAKEWADKKGIDPNVLAHAYEEAKNKTSKGQAIVGRPGAIEQKQAAQQLEDVQNQIGEAGAAAGALPRSPVAGAPFKPIPGGPVDSILTGPTGKGKIDAQFMPEAAQAEFMLQKPASSMGHRWENAAEARKDLLAHERKAIQDGDTVRAQAMRDIADTVRAKQEDMARTLLPKDQADALISQLQTADKRYRTAVLAGGDDIVRTMAAGGTKGNQAKIAFDSLAGTDETAKNLAQALVRAENRKLHGYGLGVIVGVTGALHFVPVIGTAATAVGGTISVIKAGQMLKDWMIQKGAAKMVTMKDLLSKNLTKTEDVMRRGGATIGGSAGANAVQNWLAPAPAQSTPAP